MKALLGMWGLSFLLLSCWPFLAWGTTGTLTITADTTLPEDHDGSIVIGADNVSLNCDNHTVTGGVSIGSPFPGGSRGGVTVKNCRASFFTLNRAGGATLTGNTATGSSLFYGFGFFEGFGTFTGNTAIGNAGTGFHFDHVSVILKENVATGNGGDGFRFGGGGGVTLTGNTAAGNDGTGFRLVFFGGTLKENTAMDNGGDGFYLDPATVSGMTLKENTATDNNGHRFIISGQNTLTENTADNNGGNGFYIFGSGNILKENAACHNQGFDVFQIRTGNVFKENDFCTTSGI
jgi:parallel beta-helix repeat protein